MRILHCIPTLESGGAERQLTYLAEGLVALGHEVHVASMLDGALASRLRSHGAIVHRLGWREPFDPSLVASLGRIIVAARAEVVQTWLRRMDIAGGVAAMITGRPWIYSERTVWQAGGWRQNLRLRLIAHSAAVVANSEHAAAVLRPILRRSQPLHVIANALPREEIEATPRASLRALGIPEEAELVLYVGRFAAEKNIGLLAAALGDLLIRRPRAVALCCGEGPFRSSFSRAIRDRGVGERLFAAGQRDDVWSWLKRADALISTSDFEGRPNAVLEAMACGCPLAITDIPAHREIADDETAALYPAGSVAGAVAALERVLDDRPAARQRAARAAERVRPHSIENTARAYGIIYDQLG